MKHRDYMLETLAEKEDLLNSGTSPEKADEWAQDREAFIGDNEDLLDNEALLESVFKRARKLRKAGDERPDLELWQSSLNEISGNVPTPDPMEAWAQQALASGDVDQVEAALRYRRTGRTAPEEAPEPEENPQETIGVMALSRAPAQVNRALARVTGKAMGLIEDKS